VIRARDQVPSSTGENTNRKSVKKFRATGVSTKSPPMASRWYAGGTTGLLSAEAQENRYPPDAFRHSHRDKRSSGGLTGPASPARNKETPGGVES
jgi:hypothetical protein